jgi:hypothetical protein
MCSIDGCWNPHYARGWCTSHYERFRRHGDPLGGRRRGCSIEGCKEPHKGHGWCRTHYERSWRYGDPLITDRERAMQREGRRAWLRADRKANPDRYREYERRKQEKIQADPAKHAAQKKRARDRNLWIKYKLTGDEYDAKLAAGCEICGKKTNLHVDHDHSCCPGRATCGWARTATTSLTSG